MTHEFKNMARRDGLSAVYVESTYLDLCHQGHERFDYLCNCEDGAIVWCLAELLDMKKCLPAWLRAFDLKRYNALL
jgi:hypothetical protein